MGLQRQDREFRHPGVSFLDYKQLDMDRVLTGLLPRLWFGGAPSVVIGQPDGIPIEKYVDLVLENPDQFRGFDPALTYRWLETNLLDLVNRGKPGQAVAGMRPLHGFAYRYRVGKRSRPYGADEQLYWMIRHEPGGRGARVLEDLKRFFFAGVDGRTETPTADAAVDVETQALINLAQVLRQQVTDREGKAAQGYPPLDAASARLMADDIIKLMDHQGVIPRSVLVDHLKILFAFHLARYHLRLMRLLPQRLAGQAGDPECGFFLDVAGVPGTPAAALAERSARYWYARMPEFIQGTFTVRKLDDLAAHLVRAGKRRRPAAGVFAVPELLQLLEPRYRADRETFAKSRLPGVLSAVSGSEEDPDPMVADLVGLGLDSFTTYLEIISSCRVGFHRKYLTECLDTLMLKNRPGAMIAQPRRAERRFVFDSRLLEVLLQLALLRPDGHGGLHTEPIRVDEFLAELREKYGLYIDRLPAGDGFGTPTLTDQAALRANRTAFVAKLREIGFYNDLSDAYLTQTITPRYLLTSAGPSR
ncbi:methylation-associated defense system protein MAD7 [Actinoplanes derwentensis]|uniref:Uncharacterized protein n=1 Tax=Actinoplanes derwentensis TaxID=113562 RepID=A0A1H2BRN9_9ACTN|nr:hypothetical protein [Actinoplanes derwentensis]GID83026.1 hypothetical protein Ade03nite_19500 [Actinoplanes derwentensis]SDT60868.1 hypothetical protein SAMN04489716_4833 [Actinoplanes derwentensis]